MQNENRPERGRIAQQNPAEDHQSRIEPEAAHAGAQRIEPVGQNPEKIAEEKGTGIGHGDVEAVTLHADAQLARVEDREAVDR